MGWPLDKATIIFPKYYSVYFSFNFRAFFVGNQPAVKFWQELVNFNLLYQVRRFIGCIYFDC